MKIAAAISSFISILVFLGCSGVVIEGFSTSFSIIFSSFGGGNFVFTKIDGTGGKMKGNFGGNGTPL